jgi:hypothetical protein
MAKISVFRELWEFSKQRKKFWLVPLVLILALVALFIVVFEGSAIAPFIYALF